MGVVPWSLSPTLWARLKSCCIFKQYKAESCSCKYTLFYLFLNICSIYMHIFVYVWYISVNHPMLTDSPISPNRQPDQPTNAKPRISFTNPSGSLLPCAGYPCVLHPIWTGPEIRCFELPRRNKTQGMIFGTGFFVQGLHSLKLTVRT